MIKAFQPGDSLPVRHTPKEIQGQAGDSKPASKANQDVVDWGSGEKPPQEMIGVAWKPPQPGSASKVSITALAPEAYASALAMSMMGNPMGKLMADLLTMQLAQAPDKDLAAKLEPLQIPNQPMEITPGSDSPGGLLHRKADISASGELGYLMGGIGSALPPGLFASPEEEQQRTQLKEGLKLMGGAASHLKGF